VGRWIALSVIAVCELFALSLWFGASSISSSLLAVWHVGPAWTSYVTTTVQVGFVLGAFASAYTGVADRWNARRIFAIAAVVAACLNACLLIVTNPLLALLIRLVTGVAMAGIYPISVKLVAQWFPTKRGAAVGILVAALTLGSALPHLILAFAVLANWRLFLLVGSCLAILATILILCLPDAPVPTKSGKITLRGLQEVFTNRPVMLANYGYFAHMWELYAMWTWFPFFIKSILAHRYTGTSLLVHSTVLSFVVIGLMGAIGCVLGGIVADRVGKSNLTVVALATSAFCCLAIGVTLHTSTTWTVVLSLLWGMSVIADSAQFSAAVTEFSDDMYVGTALTFQMSVGFLLTVVSIYLISLLHALFGWSTAFAVLAIGPAVGLYPMLQLRRFESHKSIVR